jgi:hypothetical protein
MADSGAVVRRTSAGCMEALIIAIVGGGGLKLKKCSATALYKAALIMHLHRVRSAAARKWSQMVSGVRAEWPTCRYITNRRGSSESRHARSPAWSHCSKGSAGDGHEIARVARPVRHADWRSLWSIEERGVHWRACHLLAICIDHTKESSSHPHHKTG